MSPHDDNDATGPRDQAPCAICHGGRFVVRTADGHRYPCVCSAGLVRRHRLAYHSLGAIAADVDAEGWWRPTVPALDAMVPNAMQQRVYQTARRFVADPTFSVLLLGDYGTGKTRVMQGMALGACDHSDVRVQPRYVKAAALAEYIKAGINDGTAVARAGEFVAAPLLCVDDLGAQYDTGYVSQKIQDILDDRYERKLPTVVTSNQTLTEMGGRVGDRFLDREVYTIHILRGASIRESGITRRIPAWGQQAPSQGSGDGTEAPLHLFRNRPVICARCDTRPCQCEGAR